ncbi:MAG TPA: TonB-dependent receptor [Caulobacteraceae bacterium]|nr:TonB-dependent receptor [Caulobacteraceae bacterium]
MNLYWNNLLSIFVGVMAGLAAAGAAAQTATGVSVAATAAAADAADATGASTVADVVVVARRQSERAQDVPIALSVVSGETLAATGAYTLADLQNNTPSLVAYEGNPRNSSLGIRGIGVSSAADGLDTSVGVYVDGVYLGRPGMALEDLIDIDQVEVLRGPQGTLYGRNTSGGVVNITTKKPSFTFGATVEGSVGDYGYNQERLSITGPLIADKLAFRLTAFNTHRDGVLPNTTTGIAANSVGRTGGRLQLLLTPTPKVSVRLIAEYSREDDTCCVSPLARVLSPGQSAATAKTLAAFAALGYTPAANPDASQNNSPQDMLTNQHAFSAEVNWDLGWAEATSITAYRYWRFDPLQDSDNTPLDIIQVNVAQTRDRQYSQEFRLASKPGRLTWQGGIFLFDQVLDDHYILNQYGRDASAFYTAYTRKPQVIAAGSQYIDDVHATAQSYAVFGQANFNVTPRLVVTGGVRYTYDEKHGLAHSSINGSPYAGAIPAFSYDVQVDNDNVSWLASASYKLSRDSLVYASYSTGYKSAGLNLDSAVAAGEPLVLRPETVRDWEVGLKQSLFERRVVVNVDAFWTELNGLQANIYPTNGAKSYLANVGNIVSRGVEADISARIWRGLDLTLSGSYDDAYYTSYPNGPCPVGGASICNLTGRPVYEAPRWIDNATATYRFNLSDKVQPYALVQYAYRSSVFGTVDDGPLTRIKAYTLVNARIGAALMGGKYDVSLWVDNLFNVKYFQNFGTNSIPGAGTFAVGGQLGTPRTVGATVRANF